MRKFLFLGIAGVGTALAATTSRENAIKYAACCVVNVLLATRFTYLTRDCTLRRKWNDLVEYKDDNNITKQGILSCFSTQLMTYSAVAYVAPAITNAFKERSNLSTAMCTVAGSAIAHAIFGQLFDKNKAYIVQDLSKGIYYPCQSKNAKGSQENLAFSATTSQFAKYYLLDGKWSGFFKAGACKTFISYCGNILTNDEAVRKDNNTVFKCLLPSNWVPAGAQFMLYYIPNYLTSVSPQFAALGVVGKATFATFVESAFINGLFRDWVKTPMRTMEESLGIA